MFDFILYYIQKLSFFKQNRLRFFFSILYNFCFKNYIFGKFCCKMNYFQSCYFFVFYRFFLFDGVVQFFKEVYKQEEEELYLDLKFRFFNGLMNV